MTNAGSYGTVDGTVIIRGASYHAEKRTDGKVYWWSDRLISGGYLHAASPLIAARFRAHK